MKKNGRKWLRLVLLAVFLGSTALLLRDFRDDLGGKAAYEAAAILAAAEQTGPAAAEEPTAAPAEETVPKRKVWVPELVEEDPELEQLQTIDLAALREVNPDVLGWIRIPGTKVDYPLLQGEDNEYYLYRTWDDRRNSVGSIFLESRNSPDLTDYNTIIYGHNMNNGSMFASIRNYVTQKYWEEHPYVYLLTDAGVYRYEIFSSYKTKTDSRAYGLSFQQKQTREEFVQHSLENAKFDTGIVPGEMDRILTLSTCAGGGYTTRWVIQARLKLVQIEV